MIQQVEFSLRPFPRGFHLITSEVLRQLPTLPKTGILNLFVRHTSCGLSLNENFDPDVRYDLKGIFERLVPDGDPRYLHQDEGPTDMSAHAKSSMVGVSLTIPITNGRLNLGTWQGIYRLSSYLVWVGVKFSNAKEEELLINDASQIGSKKFDFSIE